MVLVHGERTPIDGNAELAYADEVVTDRISQVAVVVIPLLPAIILNIVNMLGEHILSHMVVAHASETADIVVWCEHRRFSAAKAG